MSEDSPQDYVTRDMFEKVKAESIGRKERIRELEPQLADVQQMRQELVNIRVENELLRRGIQAEPEWVRVPEGGNVSEAVEAFISKYPQLVNAQPVADPGIQVTPGPAPISVSNPNPHSPGPPAQGTIPAYATREGLDAIEKDPLAKAALQEQYREWVTRENWATT